MLYVFQLCSSSSILGSTKILESSYCINFCINFFYISESFFCINLRVIILIFTHTHTHMKSEILIGITWKIQVNLSTGDIFTILSLLIHEHGLSLHLFLWFYLSELCSFHHRKFVHILSGLYLNILVLKSANVSDIVFSISNSTCSLLVYRKVIDFFILFLYHATFQ